MHSRFINIWRKQYHALYQTVVTQHIRNSPSNVKSFLLYSSNNFIPLHPQPFSIDSSKNSVDLNDEIKLEDISIEVGNPAVENIDYDSVTGGDPEVLSKLKLLVLETDSLFQDGHNVPSHLKTVDWKHMLTLPSRSQRMKHLNFLFKKEMIKANERARKEAKRASAGEFKAQAYEERSKSEHIYYGLQGNSLFHRIYDTYMNRIDNFRAMQSIQLGKFFDLFTKMYL